MTGLSRRSFQAAVEDEQLGALDVAFDEVHLQPGGPT